MRIENSFIPVQGVGETTERKLWQSGVTHWDSFDPSVVGPKTGERIEEFIDVGRKHLEMGDTRYFSDIFPGREAWRFYENFRTDCVFFDIETTGLSHQHDVVTTISTHRDGETTTLVRGDDLTGEAVSHALDAPLLVTFNGASFDVPFLETSFDLSIDVPHIDLRYTCQRLGLSGGLKSIEGNVGIERDQPSISGRDAVRLWHDHDRGVDGALETLISYNREDTVNLRALMEVVTERLHEEIFATVCRG